MRKPNPEKERVCCRYFSWLIGKRNGTYYADGRRNSPRLGRFSLGTANHAEALATLEELDRTQAVQTGQADRSVLDHSINTLSLLQGRKLYEDYVNRPAVTGGTRPATRKRYRAVLDKFLKFAETINLKSWSQINKETLRQYAAYLEALDYSYNTVYLELTTLKQINKWLIEEHHLPASCRIVLKLARDEESTTYCWTLSEFQAIVAFCYVVPELKWLAHVVLTLGLTGMRISELAQLRWSNLTFSPHPTFKLVDESRRKQAPHGRNRQTLKNRRSRSFPMNPQLVPMLQSLPHQPDGLVFHGPRAGKIKPDTIRNVFIRDVLTPLKKKFPAAGEKGFEHGRLHSFRHFFCSQCANSSVSERMLMKWLGHADAAMVRRYYHSDAQESERQMNRVSIPVVIAGGEIAGDVVR